MHSGDLDAAGRKSKRSGVLIGVDPDTFALKRYNSAPAPVTASGEDQEQEGTRP
jgi:hypothetical protein